MKGMINNLRKNNKGFTLIELLATIAILSVIVSISLYISLNVIKSARQKSYEVTINNIEKNANAYVTEFAKELFFVSNGVYEYQCITVGDLVEMDYLDNKVTDSPVADNYKVQMGDYIYVQRNAKSKSLEKSIYVSIYNNSNYVTSCMDSISAIGDITFKVQPGNNVYSRTKDVTINYIIKNGEAGNYQFIYRVYDEDAKMYKSKDNASSVEVVEIDRISTINAVIMDANSGEVLKTATLNIRNIDIEGPKILSDKINKNINDKAIIPITITDSQSGVDPSTIAVTDFDVTIGGEKPTKVELEKVRCNREDNSCDYKIIITDSEHSGEVEITVPEDSIFDCVPEEPNGNEETDMQLNLTMNSVYQLLDKNKNTTGYTRTLTKAFEKVPSDKGTIKTLMNNTSSATATNTKNVTLDTNGYTITLEKSIVNNSGASLTINGNGIVTLNADTNVVFNSGTLKTENVTLKNTYSTGAFVIRNHGTYTSNSGTQISATASGGRAIGLYNGGTISITGGTINADNVTIYDANQNGTINISGGTVNSVTNTAIYIPSNASVSSISISGGSVTGNTGISVSNAVTINVTGGFIRGKNAGGIVLSNSSATLIIGENDQTILNSPVIVGTDVAVSKVGSSLTPTWKWYDGLLYGKTNTGNYYKEPDDTPLGYHPVTVADTKYTTGGYKSYLSNVYKLTASANGGTIASTNGWTGTGSSATKNVTYNSEYGILPKPTLSGYTFDGWYTQASGGTKIEAGTNVTTASNHTIYAHWTAMAVTIQLDKNGATNTPTASVTATYGSATLTPSTITVPLKEYTVSGFGNLAASRNSTGASVDNTANLTATYTFDGWWSGATAGTQILSNETTIKIVENKTVNNFINGGKWVRTVNPTTLYARFTSKAVKLRKITKDGYICGWTTNKNGTTIEYASESNYTPTANTVMYGVCTANSYPVTASANGGAITSTSGWTGTGSSATKSVTYDGTYGTLPTVSRTGYTLDGWYTAASGGTKITTSTKVTTASSHTIYAHWTAATIILVLNSNGATNTPTASVTATYMSSAISPSTIVAPEKKYKVWGFELSASRNSTGASVSSTASLVADFALLGWWTNPTTGASVLSSGNSPTFVVQSKWVNDDYQWIRLPSEPNEPIQLYARYGSASVALPSITKDGYNCGWTTNANETSSTIPYKSGATYIPSADTKMYGYCIPTGSSVSSPVCVEGTYVGDAGCKDGRKLCTYMKADCTTENRDCGVCPTEAPPSSTSATSPTNTNTPTVNCYRCNGNTVYGPQPFYNSCDIQDGWTQAVITDCIYAQRCHKDSKQLVYITYCVGTICYDGSGNAYDRNTQLLGADNPICATSSSSISSSTSTNTSSTATSPAASTCTCKRTACSCGLTETTYINETEYDNKAACFNNCTDGGECVSSGFASNMWYCRRPVCNDTYDPDTHKWYCYTCSESGPTNYNRDVDSCTAVTQYNYCDHRLNDTGYWVNFYDCTLS